MFDIRQIQPEETYDIRPEVFQPNETKFVEMYEGDHFGDAFHLGAFLNDQLVSIASFFHDKHPSFEEENQYRLRGMATLEAYRGKGAGRAILKEGERILKKRHARLLWCHAKYPVSDYYKNFGFREYGHVFVIDTIGPHKLMYKIM